MSTRKSLRRKLAEVYLWDDHRKDNTMVSCRKEHGSPTGTEKK